MPRQRSKPEPALLVDEGFYKTSPSRYSVVNDRYVGVRWPGDKKWRYEHHLVMEHKLGRPLSPDEDVHHINGNGQDNRSCNLELWSRFRQPPGARASDLVVYALEILQKYPELAVREDCWRKVAESLASAEKLC